MPLFRHPAAQGLSAVILVLICSLLIATSLSPSALIGWASLFLVSMVPAQVVVSLLWRGASPQRIAALPQPLCGLAYFGLTALCGGLVASLALVAVGGGVMPPTPFVNMYLIMSVPVTVTLVVVFQGWPFSVFCRGQETLGATLLLAAYAVTYLLYRTLFNFNFARLAGFYLPALDPQGLLMAWYPLVASLDGLAMILVLVLFDFWPIAWLGRKMPLCARQPWFALTSLLLVGLLSAALWLGWVEYAHMDLVMFMTRVCVSLIFGIFILLVMLEGVPQLTLPQPLRGVVLTLVAAVLAVLMFALYRWVGLRAWPLSAGLPSYQLELWLASSMLSVTFPAMVFFAGYFKFWPLARADLRKSSQY